jgi:hypothetical protein
MSDEEEEEDDDDIDEDDDGDDDDEGKGGGGGSKCLYYLRPALSNTQHDISPGAAVSRAGDPRSPSRLITCTEALRAPRPYKSHNIGI